MVDVKRRTKRSTKKRARKSTEDRLRNWVQGKLEGNRWVRFSNGEISKQAKVSEYAASRVLPRIVSEMTGRPIEEVKAVRRQWWERKNSTPFQIYCIQQLRQKEWTLKDISNLIGFSYTVVQKHSLRAPVELPVTAEQEISDELGRVLKDGLGIVVDADGTIHKHDESSSGEAQESHKAQQHDRKAEAPEPTAFPTPKSEKVPPAREELPKQDKDIVQPRPAPTRASTLYDKGVALPGDEVIFLVQQLHRTGRSVEDILLEEELKVTEDQVRECLKQSPMPYPGAMDPKLNQLMIERRLDAGTHSVSDGDKKGVF